jgi:hypothetical protein
VAQSARTRASPRERATFSPRARPSGAAKAHLPRAARKRPAPQRWRSMAANGRALPPPAQGVGQPMPPPLVRRTSSRSVVADEVVQGAPHSGQMSPRMGQGRPFKGNIRLPAPLAFASIRGGSPLMARFAGRVLRSGREARDRGRDRERRKSGCGTGAVRSQPRSPRTKSWRCPPRMSAPGGRAGAPGGPWTASPGMMDYS